ncbi:PRC-barrel domain-containing protein [Chitiniphilus purpureus]|uniref:PRC-barrel domain-containing protein n=1 Tax=Chitiniphilus purpureus TaxID=2981137 RepID=A0ABY6DN83_9NEIS|nr:PRC-barrel domain-containing protein [Chitiniphilus sp. CD1]UXY15128.1 PRC-barrel domain-containing protein [Chitiniphilus sp. CD1]
MSTWNLNSGIVYDTEPPTEDAGVRCIPHEEKLVAVEPSPGSPAAAESGSGPGSRLAATDELQHYAVAGLDGTTLGTVHSLIVDLHQGRLAYVVIAPDTTRPESLLAVPWHALAHAPHERRLLLNTQRLDLTQAPLFSAANWPDMSRPEWAQAAHTYFEARPYWE